MQTFCDSCKKPGDLICFCSKLSFCISCIGPHLLLQTPLPHRPAVLKQDMARLIEYSLPKLLESEKDILEKAEKLHKTQKMIENRLENEVKAIDLFLASGVKDVGNFFRNLKVLIDEYEKKTIEELKNLCENAKVQVRNWISMIGTEGFSSDTALKDLTVCTSLLEMNDVELISKKVEFVEVGFDNVLKKVVKLLVKVNDSKSISEEESPELTMMKTQNSDSAEEPESFSRLRFSVNNSLENPRFSTRYERISYNSPPEKRKTAIIQSTSSLLSKRSLFKDLPKSLIWIDKISECLSTYNVETNETRTVFLPNKSQELEGSVWCLTSDGNLILTGGVSLSSRRQTLVIDNLTGTTFSACLMHNGRYHHTMVRVGNFLYAIGGSNGSALKDCEKYSIMTDTWQKVGNLNVAREFCSACVHRGRIYVSGGDLADSIEAYNTVSNKFSLLRMRLPSVGRTLMASIDDQMIIFQNLKVLLFDSSKMSYLELSSLSEDNWYSPCNPLVFQKQLMFIKKSSVYCFDLKTNEIKTLIALS